MFGIDDMILFPLIGSAVGGLLNRKKPLEGALLGAGLGLGGGLLAPQLGGALTATEAAAGTGLAAPGASLGQTGLTMGSGAPGLMAPANALQAPTAVASAPSMLDTLNKYKPVMDAAMNARQMTQEDRQPIVASPITPTNISTGPQGLTQLALGSNNIGQNIANETELRRARRLRQLAMMGGGNGLA